MQKKNLLKTPRLRDRKRKRFLIRMSIGFVSILFILFSISFISSSGQLTIQTIEIKGISTLDQSEVQNLVQGELVGKYWHFISRANSFFYSANRIKNNLVAKFPEIETISASRSDLNTLSVSIAEKKSFALWCKEDETSKDKYCYHLDKDGYIFSDSASFTGDLTFRYFGGIETENPIRKNFLTPEKFHTLQNFISSLATLDLKAISFAVRNDDGDYEIVLDHGPKVLLSSKASFDNTFNNLELVLENRDIGWKKKGIPASISYIDLRFDNKVFFLDAKQNVAPPSPR